jgi:hypothetical protein
MTWKNPPVKRQNIRSKKNAPAASLRGANRPPVSYIELHTVVRHLVFKLWATSLSILSLADAAPSALESITAHRKRRATNCILFRNASRIECACYDPQMLPADSFQDRKDFIAGYLNVRIYVADQATPEEIAAASNVAVRLTFEIQSMDLPIGFPLSAYDKTDSSVAIIIGSAARNFVGRSNSPIVSTSDGSRNILAIPLVQDAEQFARTLGSDVENRAPGNEEEVPLNKSFSLSSLFTSDGLLGDGDGDRIPELVETTIVLGQNVHAIEVIDFAARVAFEAAGCRIPFVVIDTVNRLPPNPILIGRSNRYLKSAGYPDRGLQALKPGEGRIEVIGTPAVGGSALVIAGSDNAGEAAALSHAAKVLPFVWNHGKDHLHLSKIESDLRQFFSQRSVSGQAAAALCNAREIAGRLSAEQAATARLDLFIEGDCRPCLDYLETQFAGFQAKAANLCGESGPLIFENTHALPWEVEDLRRRILKYLRPAIRSGSTVDIDIRISESPVIREALDQEFRRLVLDLGADPATLEIHIVAAHKQAYCWIDEILKARLKQADRIRIQYREIVPEALPAIESPHRWLHELYPIDEVLSRDLRIPLDRITFQMATSVHSATYEVSAEDASGRPILQESFEPRFAIRTMFDSFPDYARVRVNTGWFHAVIDGIVVADEQIETDPERFWNIYQSETLPGIREYIRQLYEGEPLPECAPHFSRLEVDLWLSEPDYRIGIGEERISTLEALHEDIYFETLLFFELLGLHNPGRIIPRIHPARDGQDGLARIRFTGKAGPNPRVDLKWKNHDGKACRHIQDLFPISNGNPQIKALTVRAGHSSVVSLEVTGVPDTKENIERIEAIREFHKHGIGLDWLSYEGVDELRIGSTAIPGTAAGYRQPRLEMIPKREEIARIPIVQWDAPIGPRECEQIIRRLASFPEVKVFHAGTSHLGYPIWALEVVTPSRGKYISQAKAIGTKPVLFITGRQHANEVSSTSHILKLAELLATDPEIRQLLDKVHFVLHPMTNPDGAALVEELSRDTPGFMLHAGYLGALGSDVTTEQWSENPRYPEANVRPNLWRMWLPDIVLNPHGYPSHEWVQLFAGYTAWVKSRSVTARDWWIPRGWFIPGFSYMEGSRDAAHQVREDVSVHMRSHLGSWNEKMYQRFAKYGALDPEIHKMQFCNGLLIYSSQKGLHPNPDGFTFMQRYPEITLLETVTEVPDEVAHGDWLKTLAQAGLECSLAHGKYLAENSGKTERTIQHTAHFTTLKIRRRRPWQPVP